VTNSVNRGTGARRKSGETYAIGSSRYKNLKLKKKEEKRESIAKGSAFMLPASQR
jgi:hypothetical protein